MPPANAATPASAPPAAPMVAVGSPEFNDAVAAAVALALAGSTVPAPEPMVAIGVPQPVVIQPTSIDATQPGPDDLTVRFRRFCTFQNCGYQRGQEAGFPRKAAELLLASGAGFIVHDPQSRAARAA